ncbi:MAG: methylmalonyl-CoA mutase family protein [Acidobacteriota bacterium]
MPDDRKKVWEERYRKQTREVPERKNKFETPSGIEIKPIYTPADADWLGYDADLGYPGEYPFTRGVQTTMYRGRLWTMRQYAGFGTAKKTNERFKYLLKEGQTGLSVAFDLPTQMGYDSDHPISKGEVGKVGVAIDSLEDMEILFDRIPLEEVSTSMTINATAAILLAMYVAIAMKQGADLKKLRGTVQNDPLKEYVARGTYIFPPEESMRLVTDLFSYCREHVPQWHTISISGYHIREAGATAAQEIAFTFANGIAYVEAALRRGLKLKDFCERLSFFFNSHSNFLEEVAKFRAARRLWARIMKERFHADDPSLMKMRFHTQTSGATLTANQPENNIIRVTMQALSSVLGGTQSLHTNSMDEALALPSENAARIALRTQQIIAHESGVADTIDPLAGSYLVESWTSQLEKIALDYIRRIDEIGGAIKAIESGYMQREIHNSAYRCQKEIEEAERMIVGVNVYRSSSEEKMDILKVDSSIEEEQVARLRALRKRRDNEKVSRLLAALKEEAATRGNLLPHILDAVGSYATVGEISDALRKVLGRHRETFIC